MTIAACTVLAPRPDPSRFFVLTPLSDSAPAAPGGHVGSLGLGPVHLPRYLDRPEMVTRIEANEVRPAVFDFWAGSLSRQFESVLAQNLQTLVNPERIQLYPWWGGRAPELVVEVDVNRFEPSADGRAELVVRWRVRRGSALDTLRAGDSTFTSAATTGDPQATAMVLSGLLGDFSRELAQAILAARS
jgi:uncharacterized protein